MTDYFLGLDCSTQGLTAEIINFDQMVIFYRSSVNYDKDLPHYKTQNGVTVLGEEKVVHSYPLMWVESLELMFERFKKANLPIDKIKAISGSGQQHGTVYLNNNFLKVLNKLNINEEIAKQLKDSFSRQTSPIWMDSSTSKQCQEIRNALGGMNETIKITGSNTFERFSGPQIRKFYQEQPDDYQNTAIIHLVSSFMASILGGKSAPIDHGDGAGMNLMNIKTKLWDDRALNATAPHLREKLPNLANSYDVIGKISPYFVKKYGFNPNTLIVAWSGDNPNSLIGLGLIEKGKAAISLGTSDTYFGYMKDLNLDFSGEGHVFGAPTGDYMSLICYKNGSLAREKLKESFHLNWDQFSQALTKTPPGNYGKIILPFFFPEIVPLVLEPKVYRFELEEKDIEGNVRAIIESRFLSMRLHSRWLGEKPKLIYATGGASANEEILKIAANIFNADVIQFEVTNSAALGAALRSAKTYYDFSQKNIEWQTLIKNILKIQEAHIIKKDNRYKELYDAMLELYQQCEDYALRGGKNPQNFQKKFIKKFF